MSAVAGPVARGGGGAAGARDEVLECGRRAAAAARDEVLEWCRRRAAAAARDEVLERVGAAA